ncbi:hypothetical protein Tco_0406038, partial [Tanacetum coccineum]
GRERGRMTGGRRVIRKERGRGREGEEERERDRDIERKIDGEIEGGT